MGAGQDPVILVADDVPINQVVAKRMVERSGYQADVVANGREAVEAVTENSYAAVLMDCHMPELDGYEAAREIRRGEGGAAHVPIIAVTAASVGGERERCLDAGMDDYLSKPLRSHALEETLTRWIPPEPGPAPGAPTDAQPHTPETPEPDVLDEAVVAEIESLGEDLLAELITIFFGAAPSQVLALDRAVERGDTASVAQVAHAVKAASVSVGAPRVSRIAAELELMAKGGGLDGAHSLLDRLRFSLQEASEALRRRVTKPDGDRDPK